MTTSTHDGVRFTSKLPSTIGMDVFAQAREIQHKVGRDVYAAEVAAALDLVEQQMQKGVVFYGKVGGQQSEHPAYILHDRAAVLEALHRDYIIYRAIVGGIHGKDQTAGG